MMCATVKCLMDKADQHGRVDKSWIVLVPLSGGTGYLQKMVCVTGTREYQVKFKVEFPINVAFLLCLLIAFFLSLTLFIERWFATTLYDV